MSISIFNRTINMKIFLCLDLCSTLCSAIWESKLIVVPDQSSWRFLLLLWDWRLRLLLLPLPRCLRLGLDSSDPDEFELRLRFLFAWLTMACKGLPDSLRFMSVERFFEIMIAIILIIFFFYVLLFLFGLGAPSAWKNMQSLSSCDLDCTLSFALLGAPW